MNKKVLLFLCGGILLFSSCKTLPLKGEKIDVNGMIYDTQNRPVANYRISIDGKEVCASDIGGRFLLSGIEKGEHILTGFCDGYLSLEEKVNIYDKSQILYIRVSSFEAKYRQAFDYIKKGELDKAERVIGEVTESGGENEDAAYFVEAIRRLKKRKEKTVE